jgi:hypothetical protein
VTATALSSPVPLSAPALSLSLSLGERLILLRRRIGYTQIRMARTLGVCPTVVQRIEVANGRFRFRGRVMQVHSKTIAKVESRMEILEKRTRQIQVRREELQVMGVSPRQIQRMIKRHGDLDEDAWRTMVSGTVRSRNRRTGGKGGKGNKRDGRDGQYKSK